MKSNNIHAINLEAAEADKDPVDTTDFVEALKDYKNNMTLLEKVMDKLEDFYYTLGGRHLDDLIYSIKNQFSGISRFVKGKGYITNLDIFDFPSQSAKLIAQRLRLVREGITSGESYCDWDETLKCLYPDEKERDILKILDDIIFAFEYIHDHTEHDDYFFLQAYGYERSEALDAMFLDLFKKETKISKEQATADYNQFCGEGGLVEQLRQRKEKGLQLFAKYYETLWD